jgi:hypothetical protein
LGRQRWIFFFVVIGLFSLPLAGYLGLYFWAQAQIQANPPTAIPSWPPAAARDTGIPIPPFPILDANWSKYMDGSQGFAFLYPPGWEIVETPAIAGVILYPPGADHRYPLGVISFAFVAGAPYQIGRSILSSQPAHQGLMIGGQAGQWYEDPKVTIPVQTLYVEAPHRGGTLVITATEGPMQNLVPLLVQILSTVELF